MTKPTAPTQKIARRRDWEAKLLAFIQGAKDTPFEWGKQDCALFACDAIREMTDTDLAHDFRGTYNTAMQAARAIKTFAGAGLEALVVKRTAEYSMPEIPAKFAQRGDVVLISMPDTPGSPALGIVGLCSRIAFCAGPDGLTRVPMRLWLRAWRTR